MYKKILVFSVLLIKSSIIVPMNIRDILNNHQNESMTREQQYVGLDHYLYIQLHQAVENNDKNRIKSILAHANQTVHMLKNTDKTVLCKALEIQDLETIKLLLDHDENPNRVINNANQTALEVAFTIDNNRVTAFLLFYDKIDLKHIKRPTLYYYAKAYEGTKNKPEKRKFYATCIEKMLAKGANPNLSNTENKTPLSIITKISKSQDLINNLLEHNADISITSMYKKTALHEATRIEKKEEREQVFNLLITKTFFQPSTPVLIPHQEIIIINRQTKRRKLEANEIPSLLDFSLIAITRHSKQAFLNKEYILYSLPDELHEKICKAITSHTPLSEQQYIIKNNYIPMEPLLKQHTQRYLALLKNVINTNVQANTQEPVITILNDKPIANKNIIQTLTHIINTENFEKLQHPLQQTIENSLKNKLTL